MSFLPFGVRLGLFGQFQSSIFFLHFTSHHILSSSEKDNTKLRRRRQSTKSKLSPVLSMVAKFCDQSWLLPMGTRGLNVLM